MKNSNWYRRLDAVGGWLLFAISSVVYLLTMEPTASFWDCGEFIACGHKLIVGHPPGAPFFMLLMRLFTMFAPSPEQVGVYANSLSALASGATVMFLYWSIAYMARRMVVGDRTTDPSPWQAVLIIGAAAVGALCYTFSDTFWFSAVEGEVYALSSLFTAVVFWAILKWDAEADAPHANRWIVLIALLMGLSIGVHLLNLLAIPAIVLVYYFRRYTFSWWGVTRAMIVAGAILLTVLYGVIQGLVVIASWFELLFVNGMSLPFLSGALFFFALLVVGLVLGMVYTYRRRASVANLLFTCATMLLIGYSSYAVIVIRSLANPTLDQNGADNMFALKSYLNREQYGDRPLMTGPYFTAPVVDYTEGSPVYAPRGDRYEVVNRRSEPVYDKRFVTPFPRMWSREPIHVQGYKGWVNIKGRSVEVIGPDGKMERVVIPTFGENLLFFFRYQVGFMYWRYFMWNFCGRQNDYQGYGHDLLRGNWVSGIPLVDTPRLGPQDQLPEPYRSNRAHNRYYMLPLLLGLAGMMSQFRRRPKDATVVLTLFFLTGIAIVMYLNQKPYEPRERDYTFAASFYAFAIWVGVGVVPLAGLLGRLLRERIGAAVAIALSLLLVPCIMARENWDDHDRSGRYVSVDFGKNMLNTSGKNGILFTYADNDTFPLWYAQEAEGFRTDVRICNLTYLGGDWYVDVMSRKAYDGDPLPFGMERKDYLEGNNDVVVMQDLLKRPYDLKESLGFVLSGDPNARISSPMVGGGYISRLPTNRFTVPADRRVAEELVPPQFHGQLLDTVLLSPKGSLLYKNGFAMYCLLANNEWRRPMYYSPLLPKDMYWGLDRYFATDGLVSEVFPVSFSDGAVRVDTARSYQNLVERYSFRSINAPSVYLDETCKRMIEYYVRGFATTAEGLAQMGDSAKCVRLLDHCFASLPPARVDWSYNWLPMIECYYRCGEKAKGAERVLEYAGQCIDQVHFMQLLPEHLQRMAQNEYSMAMAVLEQLVRMAKAHGDEETLAIIEKQMGSLF